MFERQLHQNRENQTAAVAAVQTPMITVKKTEDNDSGYETVSDNDDEDAEVSKTVELN